MEKQTETLKKQYRLLVMQAEKLKETNDKIIDILGTVVEYRNLESGQHIMRVKGFTRILAEQAMADYPEYGLTKEKSTSLFPPARCMISVRLPYLTTFC